MSRKFLTILIAAAVATFALAACSARTAAPAANAAVPDSSGPDIDSDGIPDSAEAVLGTDPNNADTDGDGQNDLEDPNPTFADNPIRENSTGTGFTISGLQVENNVDADGADTADHLEFKVSSTGSADLTGFELYYTITDQSTGTVQGYYRALPGLTLKTGETQTLHFDNTNQPGHYSVNPNSAFYTDVNALTLEVTMHAPGVAPQTASIAKDPAGAEGGGE